MAQPIAYTISYSFTDFQTSNPSTPLPADKLDTELANIKITTDQIRTNLALIQADDGTLHVLCVTPQSLSAATLAYLTAVGDVRGAWLTATAYIVKDLVTNGGATYIAVTAHTSGVFATDLAAGKWVLLAGSTGTVTFASLGDVVITAIADKQLITYDSGSSKYVNSLLTNDMITAGTITFASMATAFSITSTSLASASNTNVPTTTAIKTYVDNQISRGTGTPVVSASTTSLTGSTFDYIHITGTNTITAITLATDEMCWAIFDGALTLTYNATSMILPSAASITTAAGDRALFRGIDGTNVECLAYVKADGKALVANQQGVVTVKVQKFTGSNTYTPNTGMLYCIMEGVAGGGAGGGCPNSSGACGGGGGAGGESWLLATAAAVGASQTVTIGAAGAAGASTGGTGGDTSVGTLLVAKGGLGGVVGAGSTNVLGGVGGAGASGTGDTTSTGAVGGVGRGGGSGAEYSGDGGASRFGGNGPGQTYTAEAAGIAAKANSGSGGGGGASNGTAHNGGAGGSGYVRITEFCSQ